ncbi:hypothetical protein [Sphingomonas sp.]|uniref:hypothetical protein n=1 Tax=Sphingomonas sp. TaxID=28214 RepID=UPI00258F8500|nr:hypothetical protein [Sphingomonas sp.]
MHEDFKRRVERLTLLVKEDTESNREEILREMSGFAHKHEALRYFITNSIAKTSNRRLISAQSFFLYRNDYLRMRINAWYPDGGRVGYTKERFDSFFSINRCHNHSADLYTVGIFGPGYTTQFKSTSQNLTNCHVGDEISFDRAWNDQLEVGKALFIPKGTVFHTQFCPSRYSISLNLIVDQSADCLQFELEDDRKTVRRVFDFVGLEQLAANPSDA